MFQATISAFTLIVYCNDGDVILDYENCWILKLDKFDNIERGKL